MKGIYTGMSAAGFSRFRSAVPLAYRDNRQYILFM
jgi:hypothetical protein